MRNRWVSDAPFTLNGTNISKCTSYIYLGRGMLKCAHLFNTTVIPAFTYASEIWAFLKPKENAMSVIEREIERVMLGVSGFTQVRDGIRSSLLRQRSKNGDTVAFPKEKNEVGWTRHVHRFNDNRWTKATTHWVPHDIKTSAARTSTLWSDIFTKFLREKLDALHVRCKRKNY
ncbi:hypothetical protein RB195_006981 [Necator americanus]|uniref:Uncharacterized protein n=1 Tax=Necator americanus TaxID=51031 RepID=A0ABR1BYA9_NECAM